MKRMKKLTSILLALVMVLSLAVTVSAEETYSITINNSAEGYTYAAYQIFTGDLAIETEDGVTTKTLSNIQWGANATQTGAVSEEVLNGLTAENAADYVNFASTPVATTSTMTDGKYVISGLEAGYYLVKNTEVPADGVYTEYILEVVEDSIVSPKASVPSVEKKVKDTNDSTGETTGWQDSADYDIGDEVPFQLTAKLPNNVESYQGPYKVVFHDTMSEGLSFNAGSVVVKVGDTVVDSSKYTVVTDPTDACTFEVVIADAKAIGATDSSVITVEYTATLNENAVIGATGNPNKVKLEYSNNPNWEPDEGGDTPTGNTPEDKVIVFTYQVIVNKTDKDGKELAGAGFTLYKYDADATTEDKWVAVGGELSGAAMTQFVWSGLDDGDYKLVETTTPAGYNTIAPIEFTITAEHDIVWEAQEQDKVLVSLTGGDLGTGVVETGTISTNVVNQSGATLPETGGMGTTMFYVIGGLMAAAAVVLLVTKKRMHDAA